MHLSVKILSIHLASFAAIGYARIGNTTTKLVHMQSKGRIPSQALYILAICNETRFEFLFTDVSGETARREQPIFASVFDVHQYDVDNPY